MGPPDEAALNAVDAVGAVEASGAVGDDVNPEAVDDAVDDAVVQLRRAKKRLLNFAKRTKANVSREKACGAVTLS